MTIERLTGADEPAAVATLTAAFAQYPLFPALGTHGANRSRVVESFVRVMLRVTFRLGVVHATADRSAVACSLPPENVYPSHAAYLRAGILSLFLRAGWQGGRTFWRIGDAIDAAHLQQMQHKPHWYLFLLGVRPEGQGQGMSRTVLQPLFEAADRAQVPVFLETLPEQNVAIYQRLGFDLVGQTPLPAGLTNWEMVREPTNPGKAIGR